MFLQANLGGVGVLRGLPSLGLGSFGFDPNAWGSWDSEPVTPTPTTFDDGILRDASTGGLDSMTWARALVTRDYCARVACGVVQQSEAGLDKLRACGIAYPMQTQPWCGPSCSPYIDELHARYQFGCGPIAPPEPAPPPLTHPVPQMIEPVPELEIETLPEVLRPKLTTLDPESCPGCSKVCMIQIGNCCLTDLQVLALAGLLVLAVVA